MRNARMRLYAELALLAVWALLAFLVAARLELFERFADWSRQHERYDVDELGVVTAVVTVGLAVFGWRRYRESQRETRRLEEAREALLEANDRYGSLFTHNPHGVYSLDREGRFVSLNATAERIAGREASDLIGRSFTELIVPERLESTVALFETALAGNAEQAQTTIVRVGGERVVLSIKASPILVRGEVVGVYGVAEDISDRVQLQRELRRTQAAVAAALDGMVICDDAGRLLYANEAAVRICGGSSAGQLRGRRLEEFVDGSGRERFRSEVMSAVRQEGRWTGELPGVRLDGTTFALEASLSRTPDGCLVAIGRDVTDRAETETALRRSDERQRLVARVTREVIWDADLLAGTTVWSGAVDEVFGFLLDSVEIDDQWWQSRLHPEDAARAVASSEEALASGSDHWAHEYRFRHADGRYVTILSRFRILRDDAGRPVRLLGSMIDVTERRRHEEELRVARREAEEASEAKSLFLANMSHEIRTPLTSVIAGTEMILETQLTDQQARLLDRVHRSGERLLKLVDDLLDFSRIEAGEMRMDSIRFDPAAVVRQLADWAADACASKDLDFGLSMPEAMPEQVVGDPERLAQVLTNLLGNAVKFTHRGHVRLCVDPTETASDSARIRFRVEDTGTGIDPAQHGQIFRSFIQADSSITRSYGGSGLGLAISQHIVEALGGTIEVDSEPGQGSRFSFEVPFALPGGAATRAGVAG